MLPLIIFSIFNLSLGFGQTNTETVYDLVVIGGTPSGIMAAIAADREGKTSLVVERSKHIGGLPANGLGATDINTREAVGGLFKEFIGRIDTHYKTTYGHLSKQHTASHGGYRFEPSVAEKVLEEMLSEHPKIKVLKHHQFDALKENIRMVDDRIESVKILNRDSNETIEVYSRQFIDATYEGDLIAAAGVPYFIGREAKSQYNEPYAGKVYKYWGGPVGEHSTYEADKSIQAFNYRVCLTKNPDKRVSIEKPDNYNREEYLSLVDDVIQGRHSGVKYHEFLKQHPEKVKELAMSDGSVPPKVPDNPEGIKRLVHLIELPNDKSDANNQQVAMISTDLPEENWKWPDADWKWRDQFAKRLKDYTLGFFYFAQNDKALPDWFKEDIKQWGLDKEAYIDNGYFPRQVYVREGRRMDGVYHFTANDALPVKKDERPPIFNTSITSGHYSVDSHGVRKREKDRVHLDGFISYGTEPFTVPFGVMLPKRVKNLLAPVPVSGTHLGFSALRLEPTWMAMGEAAGLAASISIDKDVAVQSIDLLELQRKILKEKGVLIHFKDIKVGQKGFEGLQLMGVYGIIKSWKSNHSKRMRDSELEKMEDLFNVSLSKFKGENLKRQDFAQEFFEML